MCSVVPFGQIFCNICLHQCKSFELTNKYKTISHKKTSCCKVFGMACCTSCLLVKLQRKEQRCRHPNKTNGGTCMIDTTYQSNTIYHSEVTRLTDVYE